MQLWVQKRYNSFNYRPKADILGVVLAQQIASALGKVLDEFTTAASGLYHPLRP